MNLYQRANEQSYNPASYFPGQLSAQMSPDLQRGFDTTRALSSQGNPALSSGIGAASWLANTGGVIGNPYANGQALGQDQSYYDSMVKGNPFATGSVLSGDPFANGTMLSADPFASGSMLGNNATAMGAFLGDKNPYLSGMVEAASRPIVENFQNAVAPSLASQFSAAGRMGSGAHLAAAQNAENTLGRQLSDTSSSIYGSAYEAERARQAVAQESELARMANARNTNLGLMANLRNSNLGLMSNSLENYYNRGAQARMSLQGMQNEALNNGANRQLAAAGLAPSLEQARYIGANNLLNAGGIQQQMAQDQINREVQRHQYNAESPMNTLGQLSGILNGAAPYASQSGSQTQKMPSNPIAGAIGGGLGGYALGNSLMSAGMIMPGLGVPFALGGALLGGLFG